MEKIDSFYSDCSCYGQARIMNSVILYITKKGNQVGDKWYRYRDLVTTPNATDGTLTITYDGQDIHTKYDDLLKNPEMPTYLVVRDKGTDEFSYVGRVTDRRVVAERTKVTPLQMQFTIDTNKGEYVWAKHGHIFPKAMTNDKHYGKYKNGVIVGMNAQMIKKTLSEGIIPVMI